MARSLGCGCRLLGVCIYDHSIRRLAIQEITVNADQKVVSMDWTYANTDGHLKGVHRMLEPYGDVPLGNVTSEVALAWLQEQLANTTEEFDEYLAEQKSTEEARRLQ